MTFPPPLKRRGVPEPECPPPRAGATPPRSGPECPRGQGAHRPAPRGGQEGAAKGRPRLTPGVSGVRPAIFTKSDNSTALTFSIVEVREVFPHSPYEFLSFELSSQ